jgi:glucose-fructose oxidoreductase
MRRVVGVGFDHMHIGDQLRLAVTEPGVEVVGVLDSTPERMARVCSDVGLVDVPQALTGEADSALESWAPDVAIVCSTTAAHREWVERLAARGVHVVLEKPFGANLADVDAMMAAASGHGTALAVNWPLAWVASHRTAHRLIGDGAIGEVAEVHYYDGNRGPLRHLHDKIEVDPTAADKAEAWWYRKDAGGGSLLDYLGYGTTLGTWFRGGGEPTSVTAVAHVPAGLEVDEQSVVVASYAGGLSTFQTRWGTFTDPWTHQPQPRCGFVVTGTDGTLSSWDYEGQVTLQDRAHPQGRAVPVDEPAAHERNAIAALLHHLDTGAPLDGPMSPDICRTGQVIVDAAVRSVEEGRTVAVRPAPASGA